MKTKAKLELIKNDNRKWRINFNTIVGEIDGQEVVLYIGNDFKTVNEQGIMQKKIARILEEYQQMVSALIVCKKEICR